MELFDEYYTKYLSFADDFKTTFPDIIEPQEIVDFDQIVLLLKTAINNYGQYLAVDFFDTSNWDSIESFSYDKDTRFLSLVWHDIINTISEKNGEKPSSSGYRSKLEIQIDKIFVLFTKDKIPYLCLKGYYINKTEANKKYNTKASDVEIYRDGIMTMDVNRMVIGIKEHITVPVLNFYTISIVPKILTGPSLSQELLISVNKDSQRIEINNILNFCKTIDFNNKEEIELVGNKARKNLERTLKLLAFINHKPFINEIPESFELQKQMLGDLAESLESVINSKESYKMLKEAITVLNECSHDNGKYIKVMDVVVAIGKVFVLTQILF